MKRARVAVRRFLRDDNGAIVIDHIASFFFIILLVLLIFEICIAYFMNIRSYKAAQIGARVASILPPVHADVPLTNQRANGLGRLGMPCYNPNGLDRCVNPGGPWVCNGSDLDSSCNTDCVVFAGCDRYASDLSRFARRVGHHSLYLSPVRRNRGTVRARSECVDPGSRVRVRDLFLGQ
jgi:hypothetical protein